MAENPWWPFRNEEHWVSEYKREHGGQAPGQAPGESAKEAVNNLIWSQGYARETGQSPTQEVWDAKYAYEHGQRPRGGGGGGGGGGGRGGGEQRQTGGHSPDDVTLGSTIGAHPQDIVEFRMGLGRNPSTRQELEEFQRYGGVLGQDERGLVQAWGVTPVRLREFRSRIGKLPGSLTDLREFEQYGEVLTPELRGWTEKFGQHPSLGREFKEKFGRLPRDLDEISYYRSKGELLPTIRLGGDVETAGVPAFMRQGLPQFESYAFEGKRDPVQEQVAVINQILPFLSPLDLQTQMAEIYRMQPVGAGLYEPGERDVSGLAGRINELPGYSAQERFGAAGDVLRNLRERATIQGKEDVTPALKWLENILELGTQYGTLAGQARTRRQETEFATRLGGMLGQASRIEDLAPYVDVARQLAFPTFQQPDIFSPGNIPQRLGLQQFAFVPESMKARKYTQPGFL